MARQEEVSVQFYQEKLEANSQSLVFSRLADCYRKKGEIQQAIGVCMQGLQIHPQYVTGRVILGRCYLEQEKLEEATAEFLRVVELDRRNQVAVKMIADVYARQGMKEKAGDLYAYLLRMDPGNHSLEKLAQVNRGNGEANVLRILGIAPKMQDDALSGDEGRPQASRTSGAAFDTIADVDKTIRMDIVSKRPVSGVSDATELSEILVKTQKFDAEELSVPQEADPYRVEETVSDIGAAQEETITGDDISSRMSMIFGEEGADKKATEPEGEAMAVVPDNNDAIAAAEGSLDAPAVSGSDITSRIEQLFGEEKPSGGSVPSAADDIVSDFTQPYAPGPSALAEEAAVSIAGSPLPSVEMEPHPDRKVEAESQSLSGNDVTQRLNEMFSDSAASIAEPLDEIGKMLDQHASVIDAIAPGAAGGEPPDDLPAKSIDLGATVAADVNLDESETPADTISGDDVAFRLDTIFEEGEKTDAASGPGGAIAVHDDVAVRPEEDTRPPADAGDHAIVINGDLHESDIHEMGEETLFNVEARAEETKEPDEEAAAVEQGMSIDDAVPQDEQPEMSGDDVAGRLDEIFFNDILNNEGAEPIPDGDKEEDVVNQGFYTMSGENAETAAPAAPGDGLLSELDKSEYEEPGNDTPVATHDDVDKTVLMEHDGGDNTLAVAEEETMLSDPEPPSGQPGTATQASGSEGSIADDDDVMVNGATQISLPTTDTDVQAQTYADADADADANAAGTQFSIPDHVLTPTLADIYYQQGQPKLALQIYNRLLEADPDNDKLAKRTREIKDFIASQEAGETQIIDDGRKDSSSLRPVPAKDKGPAQSASGRGKTDGGRKPLAGVRIKKAFKSRIKKSR